MVHVLSTHHHTAATSTHRVFSVSNENSHLEAAFHPKLGVAPCAGARADVAVNNVCAGCSAGLLRRCYTQNIDSLETAAGVPKDKVVAAHGNFDSASCINCGMKHDMADIRISIEKGEVSISTSCSSHL